MIIIYIDLVHDHDGDYHHGYYNYDDADDEYDDNVIDKVWLEGHKNPQESGQDLFVGGLKLAPFSNIIMMIMIMVMVMMIMIIFQDQDVFCVYSFTYSMSEI